ncbi:MAG: sulfate adenylyltransferase subunit CysD [Candidatus Eremiobacteraeota bacterium]|nr:sulfate adenylyltransferase subunit CysD [Candidatus Eremiobacteraeota bacterium]
MQRSQLPDDLATLESQSIYILREAFARIDNPAMLWSIGKDSTALLWMVRKAFLGEVPFPLVLLDTGMEFAEVYAFRDLLVREWSLPVVNEACPPESSVDQSLPPAARHAARKTAGLRAMLERERYRAIILGIRRDEQAIRAKERIFSPRNADGSWDPQRQPPELWDYYSTDIPDGAHVRVHPLLHWTERDIWRYTQAEGIPFVSLYLASNGQRYRSLGESNITFPIRSEADTIEKIVAELETTREPERAGRAMDGESEDAFERLRTGGYM